MVLDNNTSSTGMGLLPSPMGGGAQPNSIGFIQRSISNPPGGLGYGNGLAS